MTEEYVKNIVSQNEPFYKDAYWVVEIDNYDTDYKGFATLQEMLDYSEYMYGLYDLDEDTTKSEWSHDYYIDPSYPRAIMEVYSRLQYVFDSNTTCKLVYDHILSKLP